jgi:hypothetical protein
MKIDGDSPTDPIKLQLEVVDSETVADLRRHDEGPDREGFALGALRLGVLALRQAKGEVDASTIRHEGEGLVSEMNRVLVEHAVKLTNDVASSLRQFLDPKSGLFQQRIESLIKGGGELDHLLARHLSGDGSELARTLTQHVGEGSLLLRALSPTQADGVLATMSQVIQAALADHRAQVAQEFSLDIPESALSRLIGEVTGANGELRTELKEDLDAVVGQFSLDNPRSALARLVGQVERASRSVIEQFSLDLENSSLSRMRRELLDAVRQMTEAQTDFHAEVRAQLEALKARKQEATRSTRHGDEFQVALSEVLGAEVRRLGDSFALCGTTTGRIRHCKVGDALAIPGPETAAAGECIVFEAKAQRGYSMQAAIEEARTARENREAQTAIFVFSVTAAPAGLEPITRYGQDLLVVWDPEDPSTDLRLRLSYSVARALVSAQRKAASEAEADFSVIDEALLDIKKRLEQLHDVHTWAQTAKSSAEKIQSRIQDVRKAMVADLEKLNLHVGALKEGRSA